MVCQSFLVYLTKGRPFQQENRLDPTLWTNLNICFQMATLVCNFACRSDRSTILCKFKIFVSIEGKCEWQLVAREGTSQV